MLVIDSSVVVDLLVNRGVTRELLDRLVDEPLHAPQLIDYEVASALRGLLAGGKVQESRALAGLDALEAWPMRRWSPGRELQLRAFELRHNLTPYDASYVALAEALGCPLLTRDAAMRAPGPHRASVELL